VPRVVFTSNLQRHVDCPERSVGGATVRAALEAVFAQQPRVRDYVLDDQGHLRRHVHIFVDGQRVSDSVRLDQPVGKSSEIYVMQALSGG
jgi:molybdopterin synthase sulfur carrier subunit